jgi:hypothetical protein
VARLSLGGYRSEPLGEQDDEDASSRNRGNTYAGVASPAAATSRIKDLANPVHPPVAASDARTAGRQHPRPADPHRQRGGGHGDRESAGVRNAGHAHRRHRVGARRLQEPARRHAAGHAAARRRRQCLRGRARLARDFRFPGRRRSREDRARRADGRTHFERRDHRARDRIRAQPAGTGPPRAAQRRFHEDRLGRAACTST